MSDAALDQILARHEAPALPAGLTARILRDVPLRPQLAGGGFDAAPEVPARLVAQVVPLRVVGGLDHGGRRPMMARLSAWRGAWLMLGGTGIGALAASVAAIAIFGSPFQATAPTDAAPGLVTLAAGPSSAPSAPAGSALAAPATAPVTASPASPDRASPGALALASAPPVTAPPQGAAVPAPDTSDPDPVLPPAVPDHSRLAAQSPDPGPDQPGIMGPTLGATRGAMGPFVPQGYGYSGAIGGAPGTMGPGSSASGTMQPMPGRMPAGPSLP